MTPTDARQFADGETISTDLCIIGGGPIGLSLAQALIGSGRQVTLVETGGAHRDEANESLSGGRSRSDRYAPLTMYRRRMLGGASVIWGGRCVPYDPIDYEARDWVPHSGWPFGHDTLAPYIDRATRLADAGSPDYDARSALPDSEPLIEGLDSNELTDSNLERFSLPTNFWKKLGPELTAAEDVRLVTEATCTGLEAAADGRRILSATLRTLTGKTITVTARDFVVAAGGLETYRLLANSTSVKPDGIGNDHDVLGRYFMSHVEGNFARLELRPANRRVHWGFEMAEGEIYARRRLALSPEVQREHRLLNMIVRLHHANAVNPAHGQGVLSLMFLAKSFLLGEYRRKITMVERTASSTMPKGAKFWLGHLRNITLGAPGTAAFLAMWLRKRDLATRKMPYVVLPNRHGQYPLDFNSEQVPNPDSRLRPGAERDRFGNPMIELDWQITETDIYSVARSFLLIKDEVERAGVGTITFPDGDLLDVVRENVLPIGGHHIGAARMHADPKQGVVDADLRVHGVGNLFVASTAVLPTSGHANPTLMVLALALRLADRLQNAGASA